MTGFFKRFHRYRRAGFTVSASLRYAWIVSAAIQTPLVTTR